MRALLHCAWTDDGATPFDPLFTTLVDRPFVQHVIEWLVQAGVRDIELVTGASHAALMRLLGDGTRWGARVQARRRLGATRFDLAGLYDELGQGSPLLLARADCLPAIDPAAARPPAHAVHAPAFFTVPEGAMRPRWTGWAWLTRASLAGTSRLMNAAAWQRRFDLWAAGRPCDITAPHVLAVRTAGERLAAQRLVLGGVVRDLQIGAREVEPGVWLGRGASIARETRVQGPVFVGDSARVMGGVLGPFAVVAEGAIVSDDVTVTDAGVDPLTYVGPHVELRDCVVRGQDVYHARVDGPVRVHESAWLQDLGAGGARATRA